MVAVDNFDVNLLLVFWTIRGSHSLCGEIFVAVGGENATLVSWARAVPQSLSVAQGSAVSLCDRMSKQSTNVDSRAASSPPIILPGE